MQKFDVPLEQATTPSLEALKAYSLGLKIRNVHGVGEALSYMQAAIRLDPSFAMAYDQLGAEYDAMGEVGRSSQYAKQAFQLRKHASEREELHISSSYYLTVTGELNNAERANQELIQVLPSSGAYNNLGIVYGSLGQYERAVELTNQAHVLDPNDNAPYVNLCEYQLALQRLGQARQTIREGQARHLEGSMYHYGLYTLAFLNGETLAMVEQQEWFASKPWTETFGRALASDTEAFAGHLQKARELTQSSVESAVKTDNKESGALWWETAALREAAFGNNKEARQAAVRGLKPAPEPFLSARVEAALAYAMSGDTAQAKSIAE